jgi:hypothetical protein
MDLHEGIAMDVKNYDETTFCLWTSKSPSPFVNLLYLAITTFNICQFEWTTAKAPKKNKKKEGNYLLLSPSSQHHHHRRRRQHCCRHLFHNKTIEKGDGNCLLYNKAIEISVVAFFISARPATEEKGDDNCRCLICCNNA